MSESIRSESDRRIAELEALVSGLSSEVVRLVDKLDKCEESLTKAVLTLNRMDNRQKRLYGDVRRWKHLLKGD